MFFLIKLGLDILPFISEYGALYRLVLTIIVGWKGLVLGCFEGDEGDVIGERIGVKGSRLTELLLVEEEVGMII